MQTLVRNTENVKAPFLRPRTEVARRDLSGEEGHPEAVARGRPGVGHGAEACAHGDGTLRGRW